MGCALTQSSGIVSQDPPPTLIPADTVFASVDTEAKNDSTFIQGLDEEKPLSRKVLLENQAAKWLGTPHLWGGDSAEGIDCSALVQTIYQDLFSTSLPRTTREQVRFGHKISAAKLEVGDLVFYRTSFRSRHVGIFMGDNEFLHVSKSEGVTLSSLDAPYWKSRFWMARRILPVDSSQKPEQTSPKKVGISW